MEFERKNTSHKTGKYLGFILMYAVFSAIVYFVFNLTKKLPENWTYFHILPFTLAILLLGYLIQQLVKN